MRQRDDDCTPRPSGAPSGDAGRSPSHPSNAFSDLFLERLAGREPHPATPEADLAGPWRVVRLEGDGEPLWACYVCGGRRPAPTFVGDPVGTVLRAQVHRKSRRLESGYFDHPRICLTGLWLEDAGFLLGQPYEIEVARGKLVLRTV